MTSSVASRLWLLPTTIQRRSQAIAFPKVLSVNECLVIIQNGFRDHDIHTCLLSWSSNFWGTSSITRSNSLVLKDLPFCSAAHFWTNQQKYKGRINWRHQEFTQQAPSCWKGWDKSKNSNWCGAWEQAFISQCCYSRVVVTSCSWQSKTECKWMSEGLVVIRIDYASHWATQLGLISPSCNSMIIYGLENSTQNPTNSKKLPQNFILTQLQRTAFTNPLTIQPSWFKGDWPRIGQALAPMVSAWDNGKHFKGLNKQGKSL